MTAIESAEPKTIDLRDDPGAEEIVDPVRRRRRQQRYGTGTVLDAMVAMVVGLVLAALLNIHQFVDAVEARDDLPAHEQIMSVLEPVERALEFALLDQPRKLLDRLADD